MKIPKLKVRGEVSASDVPRLMSDNGVAYHGVETVNWPEAYAYQPQVKVALAHTGRELLAHFCVSEQCLRALADADGGRVWEDSCCELFLQPQVPTAASSVGAATQDEGSVTQNGGLATQDEVPATPYYNIECNCAGTLLLAKGVDRHQRQQAPLTVMQSVRRWTSLGRGRIALTDGAASWSLALVVPASALFGAGLTDFTGLSMRANIYKCGDCLSTPHFLSLFPISTKTPDFHRPEYFQDIHFQG